MKILQLHNKYLAGLGGEDSVIQEEKALLEAHGHQVDQLFVQTDEVEGASARKLLTLAKDSIWSSASSRMVEDTVRRLQPEVVHVHNVFPVLSPSVFRAIRRAGARSVYTLHNYRLLCANALLMRDGGPCTDCIDGSRINGLKHRCYRDSLKATLPHTVSQAYNHGRGTYRNDVDAYIALTGFAKNLFARRGVPAEKIFVKPNFIAQPPTFKNIEKTKTITFVGKVVAEKGLDRLLPVWVEAMRDSDYRLQIIGDGVERERLQSTYKAANIDWRGWMDRRDVLQEVARSRFLIVPSTWYEGFPMVILESMFCGTPPIVPNLGAMPEIVDRFGIVFESNPQGIAESLRLADGLGDSEYLERSQGVLERARTLYSAEANYRLLMEAYGSLVQADETVAV